MPTDFPSFCQSIRAGMGMNRALNGDFMLPTYCLLNRRLYHHWAFWICSKLIRRVTKCCICFISWGLGYRSTGFDKYDRLVILVDEWDGVLQAKAYSLQPISITFEIIQPNKLCLNIFGVHRISRVQLCVIHRAYSLSQCSHAPIDI